MVAPQRVHESLRLPIGLGPPGWESVPGAAGRRYTGSEARCGCGEPQPPEVDYLNAGGETGNKLRAKTSTLVRCRSLGPRIFSEDTPVTEGLHRLRCEIQANGFAFSKGI